MQKKLSAFLKKAVQQALSHKKERVAALLFVALGGVFFLFTKLSESSFVVIYDELSVESSSDLAKKFQKQNIPFRVSEDGQSILVPPESVKKATMAVALSGMPLKNQPGLELLDESQFGKSNYVQRINYYRALQGELSRVISTLKNVEKSYVLISLPRKKGFLNKKNRLKTSIVLNLKKNKKLTQREITGIYTLVSHAVEDLEKENIKIVDATGKLLGGASNEQGLNLKITESKSQKEQEYEEKISSILSPIFGEKNVIVRVTAELFQRNFLNAYQEARNDKAKHYNGIEFASFSSLKNKGSLKSLSGHNLPHVERLKVAVLINEALGVKEKPFYKKIDEAKLRKLVQNAISFVEGRDSLVIETALFAESYKKAMTARKASANQKEATFFYLKLAVGMLFVVLLLFLGVRPFSLWLFRNSKGSAQVPRTYPATVSELEAQYQVIDGHESGGEDVIMAGDLEGCRSKLIALVEEDPNRVARLMSKWIFNSMSKSKFVEKDADELYSHLSERNV